MTKTEYNFFIRYIKEIGLYSEFIKEIKRQPSRRYNKPLKEYCKKIHSTQIIMNCIEWSEARKKIWQKCWVEYQNYFLKNYNEYLLYEKFNSKNT
jgi:hypothetical protein